MKKIIALLVFVAVIVGAVYVVKLNIKPKEAAPLEQTNQAKYFQERLFTLGVKNVGMPVEGFDNTMLIRAFPGLLQGDFNKVEAFEGHYEVRGNVAEFVRDQAQPISSAERTISEKGYGTLLANVSKRLAMSAESKASVDALISKINTAEVIEVKIGQEGSALGVKITPQKVLEDSRCAADVVCIWAGTVKLEALLLLGLGEAKQEFTLGQTVTTEALAITLERVEPGTKAGAPLSPADYVFYFKVTKR